jgi:hypothetical protein
VVKVFLVLGVLAVVAVVLVKGTHFYAYSEVTDAQGRTSVHCYAGCDVVDSITGGASTPEIDDAVALAKTADDPAYRDATHGMDALIRRASRMSHRSGAALVWKRAPSLIMTLDAEQTRILDRMHGLTMNTQAGELCRRAALRVISRYQWSTRDLSSHVALPVPVWEAVVRFEAEVTSSQRSFVRDLEPCLAAAPTDARATLARVMVGA